MARTKLVESLDDLTEGMFEHYDTGTLRGGIKWRNISDGKLWAECYQYNFDELLTLARDWKNMPEITEFSIVTHAGGYKRMRVLYAWTRPRSLTNS
jgi:hypothetical protein